MTYLERLRKEPLNLPSSGDLKLVFLGQLVHTQNSDDVLQRLVVLEDLLHTSGDLVMLGSNDVRVHDTAGGVKRVDSGVDSTLGHGSGQHSGGVQVSESGGGGGVSQVVSGHIDGLHGGDGPLLSGGDPLLHAAHVSGQGGLVTHSGGDTTKQSRHFGTGLKRNKYYNWSS